MKKVISIVLVLAMFFTFSSVALAKTPPIHLQIDMDEVNRIAEARMGEAAAQGIAASFLGAEVYSVWSPEGGTEMGPFGQVDWYGSSKNHGGTSFEAAVIEYGRSGSGGWAHFRDERMTLVSTTFLINLGGYLKVYRIDTSSYWTEGLFRNLIYHGIDPNVYTMRSFYAQ